jgi:hypothetical protein
MIINGTPHFTLARLLAESKRKRRARGAAETAVDVEFLEAELRAAMLAGGNAFPGLSWSAWAPPVFDLE